jgi:hypothetical protein
VEVNDRRQEGWMRMESRRDENKSTYKGRSMYEVSTVTLRTIREFATQMSAVRAFVLFPYRRGNQIHLVLV